MKILIIANNGMLGSEFYKYYKAKNVECIGLNRGVLDFENFDLLESYIENACPTVIINCAAIIDISLIEKHPEKTIKINTLLPIFLSNLSIKSGIKYVHISTDHYYDDSKLLHNEFDDVILLNHYAKQKYCSDYIVNYINDNSLVIRTSILGFRNDNTSSLITWILNALKYDDSINGFADSITSSVAVNDCVYMIDKLLKSGCTGLFNVGTSKPYSKYELIKELKYITNSKCKLIKATVKSSNVKRASNCGLNLSKYQKEVDNCIPTLQTTLNKLNIMEKYHAL